MPLPLTFGRAAKLSPNPHFRQWDDWGTSGLNVILRLACTAQRTTMRIKYLFIVRLLDVDCRVVTDTARWWLRNICESKCSGDWVTRKTHCSSLHCARDHAQMTSADRGSGPGWVATKLDVTISQPRANSLALVYWKIIGVTSREDVRSEKGVAITYASFHRC